jgi:hypothetical protein
MGLCSGTLYMAIPLRPGHLVPLSPALLLRTVLKMHRSSSTDSKIPHLAPISSLLEYIFLLSNRLQASRD